MITLVHTITAKARRLRNTRWPRYLFIHINKTAGSSIERALNLRFEHKTAMEKRAELGSLRWRRAFKFSFVRNPWDKVASHYRYRVRTNQTGMGNGHIDLSTGCKWHICITTLATSTNPECSHTKCRGCATPTIH